MDYAKLFGSAEVQKIANSMCAIAKECWRLQLSDSTGFSISAKIPNTDAILVDKSGTGFRWNQISPEDLILINGKGELLYSDSKSENRRMAPVNVVVHLYGYDALPGATGCVHWHDPWTIAFAAKAKTIQPYSLQSKLIGSVECVVVDDRKHKQDFFDQKLELEVPSGLHSRDDVYYVMEKVGQEVERKLAPRKEELEKHGIAITHFEHGLFAWGRTIEEAFENGYRSVRNAQATLLGKLVE